jgi:hypothetical protein
VDSTVVAVLPEVSLEVSLGEVLAGVLDVPVVSAVVVVLLSLVQPARASTAARTTIRGRRRIVCRGGVVGVRIDDHSDRPEVAAPVS